MTYPTPQPSVSAYKLWTAFFAMICAAIASFPYFFNPAKNQLCATIGFLAPFCATMMMLNWKVFMVTSAKAVLGIWLGIGNACLVHVIASAIDDGPWCRMWSLLLFLPESWFWALSFQPTNTKLSDWIMPQGIFILSTLGGMFYPPGDLYMCLAVAGIWVTFGFVVTCGVVTILKFTHLLPQPGPNPIAQFADAAANVFEHESARFPDVMLGCEAAATYYNDLDVAVERLVSVPLPPKVQAGAFAITSELASLQGCLAEGEFSQAMIDYVWKPFCAEFTHLRIAVSQELRDCANGNAEVSSYDLDDQARHCQSYLLECIAKSNAECARGHIEFPSAGELLRFHYVVGTMLYVAMLTEAFRKALIEEIIEATRQRKLQNAETASMTITRLAKKLVKGVVGWWKKPFWNDNEGTHTFWERFQYPIRQQCCYVFVCLPMVVGTVYSANVGYHGFWSVIPTFVCFMPTAGATLVKGNYRIIGTFLGACMAIVCVAINPHNRPAWFCELVMITFSAKLVSLYKGIWYAAWMYSITWHIVGFSSVQAPLGDDTMLKQAAWRFIFTFGGTLATSFFSACFFPDMASRRLRRISAETVVQISKKLSKSLDDMVRTRSTTSESAGRRRVKDASSSSSSSLYSEEALLDLNIFRNVATMHDLAADAKPEVVVYGKIPRVIPKVSKDVLRAQGAIDLVVKYSVSLYNSVLVTTLDSHPILADSDSVNRFSRFLHPMWEKVSQFSEALRVSARRMNDRLTGGAVDGGQQGMPDDLHVTIQQFIDNFLDIRERFVTAVLERGEIPESLRTEQCFQLYHTAYALGKFAEKWNALEGSLMNREVPSGELTALAVIEAAEKERGSPSQGRAEPKVNHTESELSRH